eukprot:Nk52_evm36s224 gene=Nk52_evmTU36s224
MRTTLQSRVEKETVSINPNRCSMLLASFAYFYVCLNLVSSTLGAVFIAHRRQNYLAASWAIACAFYAAVYVWLYRVGRKSTTCTCTGRIGDSFAASEGPQGREGWKQGRQFRRSRKWRNSINEEEEEGEREGEEMQEGGGLGLNGPYSNRRNGRPSREVKERCKSCQAAYETNPEAEVETFSLDFRRKVKFHVQPLCIFGMITGLCLAVIYWGTALIHHERVLDLRGNWIRGFFSLKLFKLSLLLRKLMKSKVDSIRHPNSLLFMPLWLKFKRAAYTLVCVLMLSLLTALLLVIANVTFFNEADWNPKGATPSNSLMEHHIGTFWKVFYDIDHILLLNLFVYILCIPYLVYSYYSHRLGLMSNHNCERSKTVGVETDGGYDSEQSHLLDMGADVYCNESEVSELLLSCPEDLEEMMSERLCGFEYKEEGFGNSYSRNRLSAKTTNACINSVSIDQTARWKFMIRMSESKLYSIYSRICLAVGVLLGLFAYAFFAYSNIELLPRLGPGSKSEEGNGRKIFIDCITIVWSLVLAYLSICFALFELSLQQAFEPIIRKMKVTLQAAKAKGKYHAIASEHHQSP